MKDILAFCPLTSMLNSGDTTHRYMLAKSKDQKTVKFAVDISKWCQFQREALVGPICEELDSIFGVDTLYESVHRTLL